MQAKLSKYFQKKSGAEIGVSSNSISTSNHENNFPENTLVKKAPSLPQLRETVRVDISQSHKLASLLAQDIFDKPVDNVEKTSNSRPLSSTTTSYTPLEKQVLALRANYPDAILMIECGYRIRFFGDDAEIASRVLGIYSRWDHNFRVASIPTHRALVHCKRLLLAGHKVAVVRQQETAAIRKATKGSKATFDRAVAGLFTAGTMIDDDDPAFRGLCLIKASTSNAQSDGSDDEENEEDGEREADEKVGDDSHGNTEEEEAWLASIYEEGGQIGLAVFSVCAQRLLMCKLPADPQRLILKDQLLNLNCSEVITMEDYDGTTMRCLESLVEASGGNQQVEEKCIKRLATMPRKRFNKDESLAAIRTLEFQLCGGEEVIEKALCGLREYLLDFHLADALTSATIERLDQNLSDERNSFHLDSVTIRDLELFQTQQQGMLNEVGEKRGLQKNRRNQFGSLYWLINHCKSGYGRRTLRSWMVNPLLSREAIINRQDLIEWLARPNESEAKAFARIAVDLLQRLPDLERIIASLYFERLSVEKLRLLLSWGQKVNAMLSFTASSSIPQLLRNWLGSVPWSEISSLSFKFVSMLVPVNGISEETSSLSGIFLPEAEATMADLQELGKAMSLAERKLSEALDEARRVLRLPTLQFSSLRTGPASKLEHLIEVPVNFGRPIPDHWVKVSATKQVMRFHNPSILSGQNELYRVRDEIKFAADRAWARFLTEIKTNLHKHLRLAIDILGRVDSALSLGEVAQYPGYCRPTYNAEEEGLGIVQGFHPVLQRLLESEGEICVPNDINLGRNFQKRRCQVVTGPNMGGKSSYVRTLGIICLMGQMGSFVPAEEASLCIFDNIFTRMGAEDDLASGRSTFMCELLRTSQILHTASSTSLVIIDELGRGTSTYDGCAIALATLKYVVHKIGCMTVFVTHFPEVAHFVERESESDGFGFNSHMSFMEIQGNSGEEEIVFLYKLKEEVSKGSYGINIARLAGMPESVLRRASTMSGWASSRFSSASLFQTDSLQTRKRQREGLDLYLSMTS
eukprot:gene8313-9165_t